MTPKAKTPSVFPDHVNGISTFDMIRFPKGVEHFVQ